MGKAVKLVPLKGRGTWEWDGVLHPPGERCSAAGGMAEAHFTGIMHVTHLGLSDWSAVQCYNFSFSPPQVFTRETFTAANGDQLILFEDETPLDPVPAGCDRGFDFIVEGGSGRFEGATGVGIAPARIEVVYRKGFRLGCAPAGPGQDGRGPGEPSPSGSKGGEGSLEGPEAQGLLEEGS